MSMACLVLICLSLSTFNFLSPPSDVECDQLLPAEPQRGGHHDGEPQHLRLLHLHAGQVAGPGKYLVTA